MLTVADSDWGRGNLRTTDEELAGGASPEATLGGGGALVRRVGEVSLDLLVT